jgi:hypothetical protein
MKELTDDQLVNKFRNYSGCGGNSLDTIYSEKQADKYEAETLSRLSAGRRAQELIKQRLLEIQKKIDAAVEENFGYAPQDDWFDRLLEERRYWEAENEHRGQSDNLMGKPTNAV